MKQIARRVADLEAKAPAAHDKVNLDLSRLSDAELGWFKATMTRLSVGEEKPNYRVASIQDLKRLEWLMMRCDPNKEVYEHGPECVCYYCQPLQDERLWSWPVSVPSDVHRPENRIWFDGFYERNLCDHNKRAIDLISADDQAEWARRVKDVSLADFITALKQVNDEY